MLLNTSLTLSSQIDGKFCRVLYTNDGSSTMIQTTPGQTVYQILKKIFNKKQIPWYKCDLYYVDENSVSDIQQRKLLWNKTDVKCSPVYSACRSMCWFPINWFQRDLFGWAVSVRVVTGADCYQHLCQSQF